jgi:hypothetical protein
MPNKKNWIITAVALAAAAAQARGVEYECDDGSAMSGYRIRVVEISKDLQEVLVLKKKNGSASLVEDRKLRRVGERFEFSHGGKRMSFKKANVDAEGNFIGTFTLPGKRGVVKASCGKVETITM